MKFTFAPESRPLDGYTIKRAIYRGGFGEVYYALTDAGREVALKLLQNNSEIELRGVQQCLNLSHPNLVTIFDVKQDREGDHWIVMEYVAGETLDAAISRHPDGMPMEEVRNWLRGMADGVAFLHEQGIVHRDLKPGNVFSERGNVKIGDVGLSKFITPSRRSAHTQSVGTVYYMAPEVAKGRYGREVDIYAMGIILYEMITGRVPFEGESTGEILMKHLSETPDLEKLPPRLRPAIGMALQKDPALRFKSVSALQQAFEAAVIGKLDPTAFASPAAETKPRPLTPSPHWSEAAEALHETYRWRPTSRAFWWILAAGLVVLVLSGEHRKDAVVLALLGSFGTYGAYSLMRRVRPRWSTDVLQFVDRDSEPLGGINTWLWPIVGWSLAVMVMGQAGIDELLGVGIPMSLAMIAFIAVCHAGLPFFFPHLAQKPRTPSPAESADRTSGPPILAETARLETPRVQPGPAQRHRQHIHQNAQRYYRQKTPSPTLYRSLTWRTRMSQFSTAATFAVPIVALLTGSVAVLSPEFFASGSGVAPGWENLALFASTAVIGSWVLMGLSKWNEGRRVDGLTRRLLQASGGGFVGLAAFWLSNVLLISPVPPPEVFGGTLWSQPVGAAFATFAKHPLVLEGGRPSLMGYVVFFSVLFSLRRWWWHADAFRSRRFRIGSVVLTVLLAWLISSFWSFPMVWAMTWAAVISSTIQLVSVWTPPEERFVGRKV